MSSSRFQLTFNVRKLTEVFQNIKMRDRILSVVCGNRHFLSILFITTNRCMNRTIFIVNGLCTMATYSDDTSYLEVVDSMPHVPCRFWQQPKHETYLYQYDIEYLGRITPFIPLKSLQ